MREILFRGKQLDSGEWVFGDLMTKYPHHEGLTIVEHGCVYHEVDPRTVGQYTGLKDKNGVKIFEGDALGGIVGGVVVWIDQETRYGISLLGEVHEVYLQELERVDLEVIGNIHDSPELLGVED